MKESESDILRAICEYLDYQGHFFWRNNNVPVYRPEKGGVFVRMPKYSMNGVPDIILIREGTFVGLEVKRPKGRQSKNQKAFEKACTEAGGEYYLVTSIDDVQEIGL